MEIDPGPQPPPRRGPSWISPRLAGILAAVLAVVVALALILPGLRLGGAPDPGGSAGPTGTAVAGSEGPTPSRTFVRPTPTPQPTPLIYFVKSGDSLISIALEFGTTARSIGFWNRDRYPTLDPESEGYQPNRIGVGWTFMLIPKTTYDEDAEPSSSPTGGPTPSPSGPATPIPAGPAAVVSHGPRARTRWR
jgi:hypothetical protein